MWQPLPASPFDSLLFRAEAVYEQSPDSAFRLTRKVLTLASPEQHSQSIAEAHRILGEVFLTQGVFGEAIKHFLQALRIRQAGEDVGQEAHLHNRLGATYQLARQKELAFQNYRIAQRLYRQINDTQGLAMTFSNLGHFYEKQAQYDSARWFERKALTLYAQGRDFEGKADVFDNLGSIFEDEERYDSAYSYFAKAFRINDSLGRENAAIINLNNIADTYRKRKQYDKARQLSRQALQRAAQIGNRYQIRSAYRDLSKIYAALGQMDSAYQMNEKAYDLYSEIFNRQATQRVAQLQLLFETERKEKQIQLLERDRRLNRLISWVTGVGLLFLLSLGLLIAYQQRLRLRKNRQLLEKSQRLREAERELAHLNEQKLKAEIENQRLQETRLREQLDAKSKTLTTQTLNLIQKNESLEELKKQLHKLSKSKPEKVPKKVKKLLNLIDYSFRLDEDWENFQRTFEQVHQDFFQTLKTHHPNLTPAETRLCALLRLNLDSHDISTILGISPDSLRVARYRLRKKLGVDKGENLVQFIHRIA